MVGTVFLAKGAADRFFGFGDKARAKCSLRSGGGLVSRQADRARDVVQRGLWKQRVLAVGRSGHTFLDFQPFE